MSIGSLALRPGLSFRRGPLARPRDDAKDLAKADLLHIFIISGPSGSGKSTFMREFVEGRLPGNISRALPAESKHWLRTSGNELSRKSLTQVLRKKSNVAGLVLHYDMMRAYSRGYEDYANDPAMQAVTSTGVPLTVLTILPSREALMDQFLSRALSGEYEEWWDRRETKRRVKRKLRSALLKLFRRSPTFLKQGHLSLLSVYATDQRLNKWTSRWENFLEGVRRGRDNVRLVYVTPDAAQGDHPAFRLLRIV
jgi:hypothetical protein